VPADYPADWIYIVCGILLVVANVGCWIGTFFLLPGTWAMAAFAALSAFFLPEQPEGLGVSWWCVVILIALAGLGEFLEFAAGAAGAAKEGASRRAMALAMVGAVIGSVVGALVGIPIPIVGSVVAALGGSALGAFVGAFLGETWKGRDQEARLAISKGAMFGRLLGTVSKIVTGVVMVTYASVEVFFF